MYRDAGNFKLFGEILLANPKQRALKDLDAAIRMHLIDQQFFNPDEVGISRLKHSKWEPALDHEWHEYVSIEIVFTEVVPDISVEEFIDRIKKLNYSKFLF